MTHDSFRFHGYSRGPQTHATRHTALLLCAFNDIWKAEKAKHAFTGGFDPSKHFSRPDLLAELSAAVAPAIKKVLKPGDVYAHLLFLSEHKIGATDSMVRNHAGPEKKGEPIFQMGKAGEELADILERRDFRRFIEGDAKHWASMTLYGRLVEAGECSPTTWTPENIESLTGLNRGQINKAIKALSVGLTASTKGGDTMEFPADSIENEGSRRHPKYKVKASLRVSSAPEVGELDFGDDNPVPPNGAGKPAQAAEAFASLLGPKKDVVVPAGTAVRPVDPPEPVSTEDVLADLGVESPPVEEPLVGAHANIQPEEVKVLQGEAARLRISLDSLVTVIIKGGIEEIETKNRERELEAVRSRQAEVQAEIEAEEAAILAESGEASRLADEAQKKLDGIRQRRAALDDRRATLSAATSPVVPAV